jgi:hypothetical protein
MTEPTEPEPSQCGRPTKSGAPCKNPRYSHFAACRTHSTAHETELAEARTAAYWDGFRAGRKSAADVAGSHVEGLQRQIDRLRQQIDAENRRLVIGSDQIVEVNGSAYYWSGDEPPLAVGDRVLLPANWFSEIKYGTGPFEGTVTALGSTYSGHLSAVIRRASNTELSLSTAE